MSNLESAASEVRRTELLDQLARLEHEQWKDWALHLIDTEELSPLRATRWLSFIKRGWDGLTSEEKFKDYEYAERVLWIVKKHLGIK